MFSLVLSVSFGDSFGCLDNVEHEVPFAVSFDDLTATCSDRLVDPAWRIRERLTNVGKKAQYDKNLIAEHSFKLIKKRREQGFQGGKKDLLQWFLEAKDDESNTLSDEVIKDFILNFTIAGESSFFLCVCPQVETPRWPCVDANCGSNSRLLFHCT